MSQHNPAGRTTAEYLRQHPEAGPRLGVRAQHLRRADRGDLAVAAATSWCATGPGWGYSQLSQRYVDESHAAFVMPPAILGDAALEAEWTAQVEAAQAAYVAAVERLMARYDWVDDKVHRRKMAREAARSVLPNATEVKIVASANVRAWRTMLELRLGEGAELEIRRMAVACLRLLQQEAPALFGDFEIYPVGATAARRDGWGFTRCEAFRETRGRRGGEGTRGEGRRCRSHARSRRFALRPRSVDCRPVRPLRHLPALFLKKLLCARTFFLP